MNASTNLCRRRNWVHQLIIAALMEMQQCVCEREGDRERPVNYLLFSWKQHSLCLPICKAILLWCFLPSIIHLFFFLYWLYVGQWGIDFSPRDSQPVTYSLSHSPSRRSSSFCSSFLYIFHHVCSFYSSFNILYPVLTGQSISNSPLSPPNSTCFHLLS